MGAPVRPPCDGGRAERLGNERADATGFSVDCGGIGKRRRLGAANGRAEGVAGDGSQPRQHVGRRLRCRCYGAPGPRLPLASPWLAAMKPASLRPSADALRGSRTAIISWPRGAVLPIALMRGGGSRTGRPSGRPARKERRCPACLAPRRASPLGIALPSLRVRADPAHALRHQLSPSRGSPLGRLRCGVLRFWIPLRPAAGRCWRDG
jgi:hypothetical protein